MSTVEQPRAVYVEVIGVAGPPAQRPIFQTSNWANSNIKPIQTHDIFVGTLFPDQPADDTDRVIDPTLQQQTLTSFHRGRGVHGHPCLVWNETLSV